ncbi:MAG: twin-arginine translocase TatA/TatE family subunit [Planctomycetes bacterium]|nr:twin-arginine translocase TatA/TatE family subunit [Planctomycetota bacterium]
MLFVAIPGLPEWGLILLVVVVLFGAKKLPELARAMGSSVTQFKKGLSEENEKLDQLGQGASEQPDEPEHK